MHKKFGVHTVHGSGNNYIICEFNEPVIISEIGIQSGIINSEFLKGFSIYGSYDGNSEWDLIYTGENESNCNLQIHELEEGADAYKFLKLTINSKWNSNVALQEILYYGSIANDVSIKKLSANNLVVCKNDTKSIKMNLVPSYANIEGLTYKSNNENIASVDSKGNVTGISEGKTNINIKDSKSGLETICEVNIIDSELLTSHITNVSASYTYSSYYPSYAFDLEYGEYGVECDSQKIWSTYSFRRFRKIYCL